MINFEHFTSSDFDIFEIEGFESRMMRIRKDISPKLKVLGDILAPKLSVMASRTLYPRIALHMRRRVNPPEETWVAFSPEPKSYKPYVHLRLAINANGIRYLCFLEAESKDKIAFSHAIHSHASFLLNYFKSNPEIICFDIPSADGTPIHGKDLNAEQLLVFAERLSQVKNQHAVFGLLLPSYSMDATQTERFLDISTKSLSKTLPLFHLLDMD